MTLTNDKGIPQVIHIHSVTYMGVMWGRIRENDMAKFSKAPTNPG